MTSFAAKYVAPVVVAAGTLSAAVAPAFAHGSLQRHLHPGEPCNVVPHEHSNKSHRPGGSHVHGGNGANQRHQHSNVSRAPRGGGWTTHPQENWRQGPTSSAPRSAYSGACVYTR